MRQEDRSPIMDLLERRVPSIMRPEGHDLSEVAVGINASINIEITGLDGTKSASLKATSAAETSQNAALRAAPMPRKVPTAEALEAYTKRRVAADLAGSKFEIQYRGVARNNLVEGMELATKEIGLLVQEVTQNRDRNARDLLLKSGLKATESGGLLPAGECAFSDLPVELRDRFASSFGESWEANGFANQDEAASFLLNSRSVRLAYSVGFMYCANPGGGIGPSGHPRPPSFAIYEIFRMGAGGSR